MRKDPWRRALVGLVLVALLMVAASFLSSRLRDERTALETLTAAEGGSGKNSPECVNGDIADETKAEGTVATSGDTSRDIYSAADPGARTNREVKGISGDMSTTEETSGERSPHDKDSNPGLGGRENSRTPSPYTVIESSLDKDTSRTQGGNEERTPPREDGNSTLLRDEHAGSSTSEEGLHERGVSVGGGGGELLGAFIKASIGLLAVAALIFGFRRFFLRRGRKGVHAAEGRLQVVGYTPLGPSCGIYEVKAGEKILLVGEAERGLSLLGELDAEELVTSEEAEIVEDEFLKLVRKEMEEVTSGGGNGRRPLVEELRWRTSRPDRRRRP